MVSKKSELIHRQVSSDCNFVWRRSDWASANETEDRLHWWCVECGTHLWKWCLICSVRACYVSLSSLSVSFGSISRDSHVEFYIEKNLQQRASQSVNGSLFRMFSNPSRTQCGIFPSCMQQLLSERKFSWFAPNATKWTNSRSSDAHVRHRTAANQQNISHNCNYERNRFEVNFPE